MNGLFLSYAHPDDETVLAAGLACRCVTMGIDVTVSIATRGEAGKAGDPPICRPDQLPAVRETELHSAMGILGVEDVVVLGYRDRELAAVPPDDIRERLVHLLRARRPRVVATFDPSGGNLHPDHVAISRFTADAVASAADERWFPNAGRPHQVARLLWTPPDRPWHMMRAPGFPNLAGVDFVVDVGPWVVQKAAALRAHRSQHLSLDRVFFSQPDVDRLLGLELFRQAWGPALGERPAADPFEGL